MTLLRILSYTTHHQRPVQWLRMLVLVLEPPKNLEVHTILQVSKLQRSGHREPCRTTCVSGAPFCQLVTARPLSCEITASFLPASSAMSQTGQQSLLLLFSTSYRENAGGNFSINVASPTLRFAILRHFSNLLEVEIIVIQDTRS